MNLLTLSYTGESSSSTHQFSHPMSKVIVKRIMKQKGSSQARMN